MTVQSQKGIDTILWNWTSIDDGQTITANLDCGSAAYATVRIIFGAEETGSATATVLALSVADDTEATSFETVTANLSPDLETTHMVRYEVDCKVRGRYLRLSFTAGTQTGSIQSSLALATLYRHSNAPSLVAALSASTDDTVVIVSG